MPEHEIYALKFAGPFTSSGAFLMWLRDWEKTEKRNYYIWCIKGAGETVIVDTGVSPRLAKERTLAGYISPSEVLSQIDVNADEVRSVILTHFHWDHSSGASLFPRATFYIQEREYHFWLKDPIANRAPFKRQSDETANPSREPIDLPSSRAIGKFCPALNVSWRLDIAWVYRLWP
jgi:glyoxylase-like metal-dependent hydrolase (beta-lactamase superfamily II)